LLWNSEAVTNPSGKIILVAGFEIVSHLRENKKHIH